MQVCGQLLLNLRLWHAAGPGDQLRILTVISRLIQVGRLAPSVMMHAVHATGSWCRCHIRQPSALPPLAVGQSTLRESSYTLPVRSTVSLL